MTVSFAIQKPFNKNYCNNRICVALPGTLQQFLKSILKGLFSFGILLQCHLSPSSWVSVEFARGQENPSFWCKLCCKLRFPSISVAEVENFLSQFFMHGRKGLLFPLSSEYHMAQLLGSIDLGIRWAAWVMAVISSVSLLIIKWSNCKKSHSSWDLQMPTCSI